MSVDKDAGAGSVVYLQKPAIRRQDGALVLVVDDEPHVRQVSERFLSSLGFRVEQAQNAYEGLVLFKAHPEQFAAVILDLKMPGKGGWQCLTEMRAIRPQVPVVICTGLEPEDKQSHLSHKRIAFLRKPFRVDDLATVLRNLINMPTHGSQ